LARLPVVCCQWHRAIGNLASRNSDATNPPIGNQARSFISADLSRPRGPWPRGAQKAWFSGRDSCVGRDSHERDGRVFDTLMDVVLLPVGRSIAINADGSRHTRTGRTRPPIVPHPPPSGSVRVAGVTTTANPCTACRCAAVLSSSIVHPSSICLPSFFHSASTPIKIQRTGARP
jgi:hypothetical protein